MHRDGRDQPGSGGVRHGMVLPGDFGPRPPAVERRIAPILSRERAGDGADVPPRERAPRPLPPRRAIPHRRLRHPRSLRPRRGPAASPPLRTGTESILLGGPKESAPDRDPPVRGAGPRPGGDRRVGRNGSSEYVFGRRRRGGPLQSYHVFSPGRAVRPRGGGFAVHSAHVFSKRLMGAPLECYKQSALSIAVEGDQAGFS
mmetsp:Transcript_17346/g.50419  ORF Transcript_17346/g.50419 Transcript_17346/m.50419 type:complete len:201 (+) Transcript_17346:658-1260(+)